MSNVKHSGSKALRVSIILLVTLFSVAPFIWMIFLSFKSSSEIMQSPLALPQHFNFDNYRSAAQVLNFGRLYANTLLVCCVSLLIEFTITFLSSFAIARMTFSPRVKSTLYGYLILGLSITPFILLFPVYRINTLLGFREQLALIMPYVATSISFNTLLLVGYLKELPAELDEAALIDGCTLRQLLWRVILPLTKPVIATVVIFNVLYIWNEFPFASVMLRDPAHYTLSMGASFFKGTYTVDYGGMIAASILIIVPELIFYFVFQKNIVEGMTAGAVKG